ncbi:MAG TPA: metal/formaldehyde-sensitive transcriptional repressor [Rhizomicrobium sp.]|nr:metal/formaldehyde-sensitive transcriptional repressor [Rhizomicrobium sp.]
MQRTTTLKSRRPKAGDSDLEPHDHTLREQNKLINRVRRLRGQVDAVERALAANASCSEIIQRVTAARGAIDGLMAELLEEHVREYLLPEKPMAEDARQRAAEELIGIIHSYLT